MLLGSCCDGSIIRWNSFYPGKVEHIELNSECEYRTLDYSCSGRRFAVAGSTRLIEVYDDERMKLICTLPKEKD